MKQDRDARRDDCEEAPDPTFHPPIMPRKRHNRSILFRAGRRFTEKEMKFKSTLIVGAALLASFSFGQDVNQKLGTLVGHPAPTFKMTDTHGKVWTNKSLMGKVVVLDFWATWCGPCKKASPVMEKLHKKYGKMGLVVVGAETMERSPLSGAKEYAKEHGYTYTFTTKNDDFTSALGINAIPAFVIIGKDGKVARTETGVPSNVDELFTSFEKTIKPLLK